MNINQNLDFETLRRVLENSSNSTEMFLLESIISDIRKKHKIPLKWKPHVCWYSVARTLIELFSEELLENESYRQLSYTNSKQIELLSSTPIGFFKHKDFFLISLFDTGLEKHYVILFTDRLKKVTNYILEKKKQTHMLTPGVYTILVDGKIKKHDITSSPMPILNDKLQDKIFKDIHQFINARQIYEKLDIPYKRGFLLYGSSGNGKTMFIKHILSKYKNSIRIICSAISIDSLNIIEQIVTDSRYDNILKIIVFEDIEEVEVYTTSALLNLLDGFNTTTNTIFFATTNRPDKLEENLTTRPGRFDGFYHVGKPQKDTRIYLALEYLTKDKKEAEQIAQLTQGFSGAFFKEIKILMNIYEIDVFEAIKLLKSRFKQLDTFKSQYFA